METNHCPNCHAPIPANAPGGFCPACLLRDAEDPPASGHSAPPLEEIAAAFPQLEVTSLIGQGGMGFVYKVRQPSLDRVVALKILSPELGRDPAFAERFAREARTLGKLHHPNIVTVFEHGEAGGFFYLIMEYVDGVNLRQAMRAGRFTPQQALAIVPGICDALQYAHEQGVWHRDIKPENILLDRDGKVKIADFGIARIVGDPQRDFTLTMTGNALGSAAYMAPEQHENPHAVDHRADIYSLGVVIYEMLTGELPLGRFPAPSQRAAVDARIDEIVFKTLEKERKLRQQSATEVKTDMHHAMQPGQCPPLRFKTMPKRIIIIGILFCLGGFSAIWDVLSDIFRSHINLNFAVFLLPVGIGLLRGKPRSQWWARFWIILGYILCALSVVVVIVSPENAHASWFDSEIRGSAAIPYVLLMLALLAVALIAVHKLLYSEKAQIYFKRTSEQDVHSATIAAPRRPLGLAKLAFGLFLFGITFPFLLWIISERAAERGIMLSALIMLLSLVLGIFSFRETLGKVAAIGSALVLLPFVLILSAYPQVANVDLDAAERPTQPQLHHSMADAQTQPLAGNEFTSPGAAMECLMGMKTLS
jgi:serine/threonine protein kinase